MLKKKKKKEEEGVCGAAHHVDLRFRESIIAGQQPYIACNASQIAGQGVPPMEKLSETDYRTEPNYQRRSFLSNTYSTWNGQR